MTLPELLGALLGRGVELSIHGDALRFSAPRGRLTPELRKRLVESKEEVKRVFEESELVALLPQSKGQTALWFLYELAPDSPSYNVMFAVRIRGELDLDVLRRALHLLADRHPILRTTYRTVGGTPIQEVRARIDIPFEVVDASTWDSDALMERLYEEADRPLNLSDGCVLRVRVFDRSMRERVVLLTIHHIAIDFWSLDLLTHELQRLYTAELRAEPAGLPVPVRQHSDYLRWQSQLLNDEEGERQWAYWRDQLQGELPELRLPTDHPRQQVPARHGGTCELQIGKGLTDRLRAIARAERATLNMTMMAAFQVLLHRYTGQQDFLIATPVANRSRRELADVVGYLVNPVAVRADVEGDPSFRTLLARVARTLTEALDHQDYPFSLLVERLRPNRSSTGTPLLQVAFVWDWQHTPGGTGDAPDRWDMEVVAHGQRGAPFELMLTLYEGPDSVLGVLQYDAALFDRATVVRMADHFGSLLEGIAADPDRRVSEMPLLSARERRTILDHWSGAGRHAEVFANLHRMFEEQAERAPDRVAVSRDREHLTFDQLNRRANQLAHHLRERGIGPDRLVGIYTQLSIETVIAVLGVLKASGAYLPLEPSLPKKRLQRMLEDANASVILCTRQLAEGLPSRQAEILVLDADSDALAGYPTHNLTPDPDPRNLAYVLHTSGSTGAPKGVGVPHLGLSGYAGWCANAYYRGSGRGAPVHSSLGFDFTITSLIAPLLAGERVVLVAGQSPDGLARVLEEEGPFTLVKLTPAHLDLLNAADVDVPAAVVVVGGEALRGETLGHRFSGKRIINEYGPTEAVVGCCVHELAAVPSTGPVAIGRPIPGAELYILDSRLEPTPAGVVGELHIAGRCLARGYLGRPDLTAERFIANPFSERGGERLYKTGDLARYKANGEIEFLGRTDSQVKVRGYRVELGEIEAVLCQHPALRSAVATLHRDEAGEASIAAYVVSAPPAPTVPEIRAFLEERLPGYMIPSRYRHVEALPLTTDGKVDRRALASLDTVVAQRADPVPARTEREQILLTLFAELLRVDGPGIHDDFFELGGHSLLALQLCSRIRDVLHVEVPLQTLFSARTVARLAAAIDGMEVVETAPRELPIARVSRERYRVSADDLGQWISTHGRN